MIMYFPGLFYSLDSKEKATENIKITPSRKKELDKLKERRGETYDSILERLIEDHKKLEKQME